MAFFQLAQQSRVMKTEGEIKMKRNPIYLLNHASVVMALCAATVVQPACALTTVPTEITVHRDQSAVLIGELKEPRSSRSFCFFAEETKPVGLLACWEEIHHAKNRADPDPQVVFAVDQGAVTNN
jgi:hypothetical protein